MYGACAPRGAPAAPAGPPLLVGLRLLLVRSALPAARWRPPPAAARPWPGPWLSTSTLWVRWCLTNGLEGEGCDRPGR